MTAFETPAHLSSWAGVRPGQNESTGKSKPARTRPRNANLKAALGIAAMAAARTNGSFFHTATSASPHTADHSEPSSGSSTR